MKKFAILREKSGRRGTFSARCISRYARALCNRHVERYVDRYVATLRLISCITHANSLSVQKTTHLGENDLRSSRATLRSTLRATLRATLRSTLRGYNKSNVIQNTLREVNGSLLYSIEL